MSRSSTTIPARAPRRKRADFKTLALYIRALVREFRWTLAALVAALSLGAFLYAITPLTELGGKPPTLMHSAYAAWSALLGQPIFTPPATWYLAVVDGLYPVIGFGLIGQGIVRMVLLAASRRHGEKEWMHVMASTYRDHVVLCGLGHLGYRVLEHLVANGVPVVALEKDADGRFAAQAKATGAPILFRDMKDDQSLVDAGVKLARSIIIATNDDMANLEVALDSRRLNPDIRIVMRLFDQQIASKIAHAITVDSAFSSSSLAAPVVAALSMETPILASFPIGGVFFAVAEFAVEKGSTVDGKRVVEIEAEHGLRALSLCTGGESRTPAPSDAVVSGGDRVTIHVAADRVPTIAAAFRSKRS